MVVLCLVFCLAGLACLMIGVFTAHKFPFWYWRAQAWCDFGAGFALLFISVLLYIALGAS